MAELLPVIVSGLLGGGLFGAIATLYRAKKTAPAERDNFVVGGAETAVLSLEKSLAAETRRAERAEAAEARAQEIIAAKDARIDLLERKIDDMQRTLDQMRTELHEIRGT